MSHINYQSLRGKVLAYAPAEPAGNPHLWVILEAEGQKYFATINVRSNKDAPGDPIGKSYLYYFIDADYDHPIVPAILERPQGMSQVERSYPGGALDFQRGALFNPNAMRVLPMEGPGDDGLVHRLTANLQLAKQQDCEVILYGNAFAKDNPHQTDAAFGFTPDTPFGLDNVHMAQGDPRQIDAHLHENGVWHDGATFIWDARARRMTAIFLAFQGQAWHTDASGDLIHGETGCEPPSYDYSGATPRIIPAPQRAAEIISAHKNIDGTGVAIVANMSSAPLDVSGWRLLINAELDAPLPAQKKLAPGEPLSIALPVGALDDRGGLITLLNASGLRVDGEAYRGGDGAKGWSTSFG